MYLMCTHTVAIVMSSDTPDPEPDNEYFIPTDKPCDQKVEKNVDGDGQGKKTRIFLNNLTPENVMVNFLLLYAGQGKKPDFF